MHIYRRCDWGKSCEEHGCEKCEEALNMAIEALKADTVQCGECLHMKAESGDEGTCFYWCKHWENATDSWGWCYYGERR